MAQRRIVSGRRSVLIWLSILIVLLLLLALAVIALFIYPNYQRQQQVEQRYQAGIAFQDMGDWDKAVEAFEKVIAIDATYKDERTRLAEVKAKQKEATDMARAGAATATADALEAHYQKGLGYMNIGWWEEAKAELEQVFEVDPNYKDVQAQLAMVNSEVMRLTPTAMPTPSATPTPTFLFTDDFTDGAAPEWIQTHGTWIVVDGQYEGVGAGNGVDAWTYVGDKTWTDYSFQARIIFESGNGEMVFRSTEHWRNEYRLGIWWQQSPDYANHLGLSKYKQGVSTMLWDQGCPIPITNPVDVKVDVIGSKIRVYINDSKVIDIYDPDPLEQGKVGLGVIWNWRAKFDNVQVKALASP